jgi:hypothetical protein
VAVVITVAWLGLVVWLLVAATVGGYHLLGLRTSLGRAEAGVQQDDVDVERTVAQLTRAGEHAAGARRWLGSEPWTWMTGLPGIGGTVEAVTVLADAAGSVVPPLATAGGAVLSADASDLLGIAQAAQQQVPALDAAAAAAAAAEPRVRAVDPSRVVGPVQAPVAQAREQVLSAAPAIAAAATAADVLPNLLGVDGRVEWVLVAAQPAEPRGSGAGFFGAFGVMRADRGALTFRPSPNDRIFGVPADLTQLPPEFAELWGQQAAYVWGHNLTRHYPYAASLLRQTVSTLGVDPRYVVSLDPRVVAALLRLTGPVSAAGVEISAANAERYLTRQVYRQFPDGQAKDEVVLALMSELFDRLATADLSPQAVAAALAEPVAQERLVVWAADPQEQARLERSGIAGAVPEGGSSMTVAINNASGGKMHAYLDSAIAVTLRGRCEDPTTAGVVDVRLRVSLPPGLPPYVAGQPTRRGAYGSSAILLHVYGPQDAELDRLTVDGAPVAWTRGTERGHPVWGTRVTLPADTQVRVRARFRQPSTQARPTPPKVTLQPLVTDTVLSVRDERSCGGD